MNEKSKSTQQSMPPVSSTPSTTTTTTPIPDELQVFDPSEMFLKPTVNASNPQTTTPATTTDNDNQTNDKKNADEKKSQKRKAVVNSNTSVYLTGLPSDITEGELFQWAKKAGVIKKDADTEEPKIKIYRDDDGNCKGDGTIVFLFRESIQQAILLLDGDQIRVGYPIKVEEAVFDKSKFEKGVGKRKGAIKRRKRVLTTQQQKDQALNWNEDMYEKRHVVIFNLFDAKKVDPTDLDFYTDLTNELRAEATKLGKIESLHVFERSPLGAAVIKFEEWLGADRCIRLMNGRWFDGQQLKCEYYDGRSDYAVEESAESRALRDAAFAQWLGEDGDDDNDNKK